MIRDLPKLDKPREKAFANGINALTDTELLAILIRTGTKNESALDISRKIINEIGSIKNIDQISIERLSTIKGVGKTKSITILSALELGKRSLKNDNKLFKANNSNIIYENMKYYFYKLKQEKFYVIYLDKRKNALQIKELYIGTSNLINVELNEIFKEAYLFNASYLVLIHNHPSGLLYPSKSDYISTQNIINAGKVLNINVLDHIIITDDGYYSFHDNGEIK